MGNPVYSGGKKIKHGCYEEADCLKEKQFFGVVKAGERETEGVGLNEEDRLFFIACTRPHKPDHSGGGGTDEERPSSVVLLFCRIPGKD